jgi:RHS repeat-associated protein
MVRVTTNLQVAVEAAWASDNSRLALSSRGDLFTVKPDGTGLTNITNAAAAQNLFPEYAPQPRPKQLYFIHPDHLNTPRLIADKDQKTVWRWNQQEPFGVTVPDENPSGVGAFEFPLRFPGQYADRETNLTYNAFRDYDPGIGRYGQSDPIGLHGGLNTYLYGNGDPLRFVDPRGENAGVVVLGGAVLIGGAILMSPPARKAIKDIIKDICRPSTKDPCDQQQEDEEQQCWNDYGSVFGPGHFSYRGCMERARTRGDLCRRGLPTPPQWSDADVTGHPRPPKPPKVK